MASAKEKIVQTVQDNQSVLIKGALIAGGIYLTYRVGKNLIAKVNKNNAQKNTDDKPEVRQAMSLRSSVNPSGYSWMKSFDTTNVDTVMEIAKTITNLDKVQKAYKDLYQDNLLDDLQSDLSTGEYEAFLNIIASNANKDTSNGGAPPVQYTKKNQLIVAKKDVTLRSSPDASNHGAFYEVFSEDNIYRVAKAGEFLGYATGQQHYDEVNNVKFIQVAYVINAKYAPTAYKKKNKVKMSFWISASSNYTVQFPNAKAMISVYPKTSSTAAWKKPLDYFDLKGIPTPRLLTKSSAVILNERFAPINHASANTILGQLMMSMQTKQGVLLKFRTIDNTIRWVDQRYIQLQETL
jgi:hypothetical protein